MDSSQTIDDQFENFCCVINQIKGEELKSPRQILNLTEPCFNLNITLRRQWQHIEYLRDNVSFIEEECSRECNKPTTTINYFYFVVFVLIFIINISSNALVIFSILKTKLLRSNTPNLFILSLAFSDFLVGATVIPFKIKQSLDNLYFCSNVQWCRFHITTDNIFFCTSITNLLVIALDRFIALNYTYNYPNLLSRTRAKVLILLIWIYGALWGSSTNMKWGINSNEISIILIDEQCQLNSKSYFVYFVFVVVFLIPVFLMGLIYFRIFLIAKHHAFDIASVTACSNSDRRRSSIREINPDVTQQITLKDFLQQTKKRTRSSLKHKEQTLQYYKMVFKASRTVATVYGTFVVAWSPICVISIVWAICNTCLRNVDNRWYFVVFLSFFPVLSSTTNPFIYAILSKQYRKAFKRILIGNSNVCLLWTERRHQKKRMLDRSCHSELL
jgi:7 transmembrane receptor (rhodopsin family).